VIATKFGWGQGPGDGAAHGSPNVIRSSLDASLRRLRTDRVDIYYYHRPDGITPIGETLGALGDLVREGLVRLAACSNVGVPDLVEAEAATNGGRFSAVQNTFNLLDQEARNSVLPWSRSHGLGFVPSRPLAQGLLTGKYREGEPLPPSSRLQSRPEEATRARLARVEQLEAHAAAHGRTLLELAIGALVAEDGVSSLIAGAMTVEQVRANAEAGANALSADELAGL